MTAARFPEEWLDQVRNSFNIVDFIGQYVQLRKSGRSFMGLCPFHSEKTPSFSVLEEKQIFHCFGCSEGGNLFTFLMKLEELTFPEAVIHLADSAGIRLPEGYLQNRMETEQQQSKQRMFSAYELVVKLYHYLLFKTDYGKAARRYLSERGIDQETAEQFQIGYAPDSWEFVTDFFEKRDYDHSLLQQAGLLGKREYDQKPFDLFRNRLMFPIADTQGRVIAFGGRILGDEQPKYINSPEHQLFNKSHILFNFYRSRREIRKKRQAVLFEGYMDAIAAWQAGVHNGVASLGTSLTETQATLLKRNADQVIICYDADSAGIDAAMKAAEVLLSVNCQVKVVSLGEGLDPDDYIQRYGATKFQLKIEEAATVTSFKMEYLRKQFDLSDEAQRMNYIQAALEQIASLPNAVERDHYLRFLSEEFNYSLDALKQEQRKIYFQQKKAGNRDKVAGKWNNSINNGTHVPVRSLLPAYHNAEKKLISLMLHDEKWAEDIMQRVGGNFNVDEFAALAAHLYSFYSVGNTSNPSKFISELEDEKLIQLASQLALEGSDDITTSKEEISDYIHQVLSYPVWRQIDSLKDEQRRLEKLGDNLKAAQVGIEIHHLIKSLKPLST
ncbi:DNA primase [Ammoniphilus oxalaticus]|uniref:DNA primase n=1 Tax=Ammoniphilus oxalaticus TaxID=66863 RepID=A0A419SJ47_9BACL|nr:DNA primase [Ammoniphilus oxalaticus]RKD24015.1 DNA primase [Ammoniphilus oxalaticus]